jgi:protein-disulfide isomerase
VRIDLFVDFLCPFCRAFEEGSADVLGRLAAADAVDLVYHPVAFLERLSTAHYPSRASAASGAAADGGRFSAFKDALFANQPEEGGPGLDDEELVAIGAGVGLDSGSFGASVRDQAYLPWAAYVTAQAIEDGVSGTPSVFVDGDQVEADPAQIEAAVQRAGAR